jgi:hypothetical protein
MKGCCLQLSKRSVLLLSLRSQRRALTPIQNTTSTGSVRCQLEEASAECPPSSSSFGRDCSIQCADVSAHCDVFIIS